MAARIPGFTFALVLIGAATQGALGAGAASLWLTHGVWIAVTLAFALAFARARTEPSPPVVGHA